jgi:hypothetical protein
MLGAVISLIEIVWHGGHSAAMCSTLKLLEVYVEIVNLRLGGAIRGKQRTVGWEGQVV